MENEFALRVNYTDNLNGLKIQNGQETPTYGLGTTVLQRLFFFEPLQPIQLYHLTIVYV